MAATRREDEEEDEGEDDACFVFCFVGEGRKAEDEEVSFFFDDGSDRAASIPVSKFF